MSHYTDLAARIRREMVPLPIPYREDYSIDHVGLARYVSWHLENGTKNFCLTFTYSVLDFVTNDEIVDITRTVANVVKDDAVFLSCTGGGPLQTTIETVKQIEEAGAHGAFVHLPEHCLQNSFMAGELYVKYIREVAKETEIPLLAVALGVPWTYPMQAMLPVNLLEELCQVEQFIGLKDDVYILDNRREISMKFGQRLAVIGGGIFDHYIFFHHLPCQSEFHGIFNPKRARRQFELLDKNDYQGVFQMLEEEAKAGLSMGEPHWIARNQVMFYGMGFTETCLMRAPIDSATPEQAKQIIRHMRDNPIVFEQVSPDR